MPETFVKPSASAEHERMHDLYREGGRARRKAPHIVYSDAACPYEGCDQTLQAIDFRLGDHGRDVHDPLVRAWWDDRGFVGRCPGCDGCIHFTIRDKRAVTDDEAAAYLRLPDDWFVKATVL